MERCRAKIELEYADKVQQNQKKNGKDVDKINKKINQSRESGMRKDKDR